MSDEGKYADAVAKIRKGATGDAYKSAREQKRDAAREMFAKAKTREDRRKVKDHIRDVSVGKVQGGVTRADSRAQTSQQATVPQQ